MIFYIAIVVYTPALALEQVLTHTGSALYPVSV